jgi:hypothetical protein
MGTLSPLIIWPGLEAIWQLVLRIHLKNPSASLIRSDDALPRPWGSGVQGHGHMSHVALGLYSSRTQVCIRAYRLQEGALPNRLSHLRGARAPDGTPFGSSCVENKPNR